MYVVKKSSYFIFHYEFQRRWIQKKLTTHCRCRFLLKLSDQTGSMDASKRRRIAITKAIIQCIHNADAQDAKRKPTKVVKRFTSWIALFRLILAAYRRADFLSLRRDYWDMNEEDYLKSFEADSSPCRARDHDEILEPAGDLGYSGSTFFYTKNGKYLVKSLDRRFESDFLMFELFEPYMMHMKTHPQSLLVRITDTLYAPHASLGTIIGIQPRHYIIMENILDMHIQQRNGREDVPWEKYDLKPEDYFFPERDIANGRLASQEVKDKLVDKFNDKVELSADLKQGLKDIISEDTAFLAANNAVDYSLFFARISLECSALAANDRECIIATVARSPSWRTGVLSTDRKWVYRAVLLDFLWAKHKLHAKAMSSVIWMFNLLFNKGPMTITTEPYEYRTRFLNMVDDLLSRDVETPS